MKRIKSKRFPFKGFDAITIYPFIFYHPDAAMTAEDWNEEEIHGVQQKEMLLIGFYPWYGIEVAIEGYGHTSFEREAKANKNNLDYLKTRKPYAWLNY